MPNKMERISEASETFHVSNPCIVIDSSSSCSSSEGVFLKPPPLPFVKPRSNSGPTITYLHSCSQSFQNFIMFQNGGNEIHSDSAEFLNNAERGIVSSNPTSRRMTDTSDDVREYILRANHAKQILSQQIMVMLQGTYGSHSSLRSNHEVIISQVAKVANTKDHEEISIPLSALYAKIIVFLGVAFPVTDVISSKTTPSFYQGFYLYLYTVSVFFIVFAYATQVRYRLGGRFAKRVEDSTNEKNKEKRHENRHGSFYLRVGAICFGIGSMVYTGLEIGQYFELKDDDACQDALVAITPLIRLTLSLLQIYFIFINTKLPEFGGHKFIAMFGLMHLVATNLCEWLFVLIEETKHEIVHMAHHDYTFRPEVEKQNLTAIAESMEHHLQTRGTNIYVECRRSNIMGNLVQNASPFLFPCTIEYSLICAVILFEIWKHLTADDHHHIHPYKVQKDTHQLSINCAGSHRGMFCGILIVVLTLISLIMYFVLSKEMPYYQAAAVKEVTYCEIMLYVVMLIGVIGATYKMKDLRYSSKRKESGMSLDCTLLLIAQSGIYIYSMFSIIGCYFAISYDGSEDYDATVGLIAEILSIVQTTLQTLFVLQGWWKRCKGPEQRSRKPGRQYITFLLIANMSQWIVNCLIKQRAGFRPTHLEVFGIWAWTILTHISMPLSIFYRFHSTICLFEIWKYTYKYKPAMIPKVRSKPKIKVTNS